MKTLIISVLCAMLTCFSFTLWASDSKTSTDLDVSITNGWTVVSWKGQIVFQKQVKGAVTAQSRSVNGTDYAAAYCDSLVIWESAPGAAELLKTQLPAPAPLIKPGTNANERIATNYFNATRSSFSATTTNGQTTAYWNGQMVFNGPTKNNVSCKNKSLNGIIYAAIFDGENVLWENVKGAADMVK